MTSSILATLNFKSPSNLTKQRKKKYTLLSKPCEVEDRPLSEDVIEKQETRLSNSSKHVHSADLKLQVINYILKYHGLSSVHSSLIITVACTVHACMNLLCHVEIDHTTVHFCVWMYVQLSCMQLPMEQK